MISGGLVVQLALAEGQRRRIGLMLAGRHQYATSDCSFFFF